MKGSGSRYSSASDHKLLLWILGVVIVLLILILLIIFVGKPQYDRYINGKGIEGYNIGIQQGYLACLNDVVTTVGEEGFVAIPVGQNQSLLLAPFVPQME